VSSFIDWVKGTSCSSEVVFETLNVVFTEIIAALHLDEDQILVGGILHSMGRADRDVDRFAGANRDLSTIERNLGSSLYDHPVFGALRVFLVAESLSRQHFDSLDLERASFFQDRVGTPGPLIKLSQSLDPPGLGNLLSARGVVKCFYLLEDRKKPSTD
jgi:hypothetical protein